MRYLLILAILAISMCTGLPEIPFINPGNTSIQKSGIITVDTESPDVFIRAEFIPSEVKGGRPASIFFELKNKNTFNLKNITLFVYDSCIFSGNTTKTIDELKINRSIQWSWSWKAGNTSLDKDCKVKFRVTYDAEYSIFQDIAVLSSSEYQLKEVEGTLGDVPIQISSTESPFKVTLSFSDKQPFIENENYYLNLDYYNSGIGVIDFKALTITTPDNVENFNCSDYNYKTKAELCTLFFKSKPGDFWYSFCDANHDGIVDINDIILLGGVMSNTLNINRKLTFVKNRAAGSVCSFTTKTSQPMDIKSLTITASYKYILDNSILMRVKRT